MKTSEHPNIKIQYTCPYCDKGYKDKDKALLCRNQGIESYDTLKVGDIVTAGAGFHWFDGDVKWVINPDVDLRGHDKSMGFYYVITHIGTMGHQAEYHIETLAMTGNNGHRGGKTYQKTHTPIKAADKIPISIKSASEKLIGNKFNHIL